MPGNNPLAEYETDDLVKEVSSRLQPDPRVGLLFMVSDVDDQERLSFTLVTGGSDQGVAFLLAALLERAKTGVPEKSDTVVLN